MSSYFTLLSRKFKEHISLSAPWRNRKEFHIFLWISFREGGHIIPFIFPRVECQPDIFVRKLLDGVIMNRVSWTKLILPIDTKGKCWRGNFFQIRLNHESLCQCLLFFSFFFYAPLLHWHSRTAFFSCFSY